MSKPIDTIRINGVNIAVFSEPSQYGERLSFTIQKSWKDKQTQQWKNSNFINSQDFGNLLVAVTIACTKYANRPPQAQPAGQPSAVPPQQENFDPDEPYGG